jgi:hypothetical protein
MRLSAVCFLLLNLPVLAFAKPWVFTFTPNENVFFCDVQRDDVEGLNRKLMVSAVIDVDADKAISMKELGGNPGEGRIDFMPSQVHNGDLIVPSGKISVQIYGSKFCDRYLVNGKDATKTFNEILAELFK